MFERVAGELRAKLLSGGEAWPGFETTHQATQHTTSATGVEGAGGAAAVPVGGGGAWPGFESTHPATPRNASAAGAEGAGGSGGHGRASRHGAERSEVA